MFALVLAGGLLSTAKVSVDGRVPLAEFPALSAMVGLVANAMGIDRTEHARLDQLQSSMDAAFRIDRAGEEIIDYQTAQLQASDRMWTSHGVPASRAGSASTYESPAIAHKHYWADRVVSCVLSLPPELEDRAIEALAKPARTLFVGRASCIPSRRILLGPVRGGDLLDALVRLPAQADQMPQAVRAQWPDGLEGGIASRPVMVHDVKDWRSGRHLESRVVRQGNIVVGEIR